MVLRHDPVVNERSRPAEAGANPVDPAFRHYCQGILRDAAEFSVPPTRRRIPL